MAMFNRHVSLPEATFKCWILQKTMVDYWRVRIAMLSMHAKWLKKGCFKASEAVGLKQGSTCGTRVWGTAHWALPNTPADGFEIASCGSSCGSSCGWNDLTCSSLKPDRVQFLHWTMDQSKKPIIIMYQSKDIVDQVVSPSAYWNLPAPDGLKKCGFNRTSMKYIHLLCTSVCVCVFKNMGVINNMCVYIYICIHVCICILYVYSTVGMYHTCKLWVFHAVFPLWS